MRQVDLADAAVVVSTLIFAAKLVFYDLFQKCLRCNLPSGALHHGQRLEREKLVWVLTLVDPATAAPTVPATEASAAVVASATTAPAHRLWRVYRGTRAFAAVFAALTLRLVHLDCLLEGEAELHEGCQVGDRI